MSLQERALRLFDEAAAQLDGAPSDGELRRLLLQARDEIRLPMRVAVVGRVKTGKSTLMNALLEGQFAPTGPEELTYNVNWFVHGQAPGLSVFFKDNRPAERRPLDWLDRLVNRNSAEAELLRSIRHVEVQLPQPILLRLQLIDTPGFGSFFDTDSRNTLEFLGMSTSELDVVTRDHAIGADAVLYLFTRSMSATDHSLVEDFQGAALGDFTPVNAIAVLTKADAYWSSDSPDDDPIDTGARIANRLAAEAGVDRTFFQIMPVCGKLAAGAATLSAADVADLQELATIPPEGLLRRLRYAGQFATKDYDDVPVSPVRRAALLERLGQYGIWISCAHLRAGGPDQSVLRDHLFDRSGIRQLRDLLLSHFGNRAAVIKTSGSVNRCRVACARLAQGIGGSGPKPSSTVSSVAGRLEAFEIDEYAIAELDLLRSLYRDDRQLGLTPTEVGELLLVTGERGTTCAARLGFDQTAAADEMLVVAANRLRYWRNRANQFGISSGTLGAIRGIQRSYELISHHLREAIKHLEMDA